MKSLKESRSSSHSAPSGAPVSWTCAAWLGGGVMHLLGSLVVGAALGVMLTDGATVQSLLWGAGREAMGDDLSGLALHLGLSALLWGALYLGVTGLRRESRTARRVVRLARGQAMVETLIVITPFLLLTSGLSQLLINNMAGMLTHLAAYQAGRACWVWQPETERLPLNNGDPRANERARTAAAAALAPVASGPPFSGAGMSLEVSHLAGIMRGHFSDESAPQSTPVMSSGPPAPINSFIDALDGGGDAGNRAFGSRAARKLLLAYSDLEPIDCTVPPSSPTFTVNVAYHHYLAFPWFAYIFEDSSTGQPGFFTIRRSYTLPVQLPVTD